MKTTRHFVTYVFVAAAALALTACGSSNNRTAGTNPNNSTNTTAQNNNNPDNSPNGMAERTTSLSGSDRDFITNAAQRGMAEVEMARLARERASSPEVKKLAQNMAEDHSKLNDQIRQTASANNVNLPNDIDSSDRSEIKKLSGLHGAKFDREFVKTAIDDHKRDIKDFEHVADNSTDPQLKTLASNALPKMRDHLQMAQDWESGAKNNSTNK